MRIYVVEIEILLENKSPFRIFCCLHILHRIELTSVQTFQEFEFLPAENTITSSSGSAFCSEGDIDDVTYSF